MNEQIVNYNDDYLPYNPILAIFKAMENTKLIVNGIDVLSLYQKDCLFNKQCTLGYVATKDAKGNEHIRTQCAKCGYQTGSPIPKSIIQPSDKVKRFNKRLYNAAYKKKLEKVFAMSGQNEEISKRLQQIKKAVKLGRWLQPAKSKNAKPV